MPRQWRWRAAGLLLGVLAAIPAGAGAQVDPVGFGTCVGVSPGGTTDCRAVEVQLGIIGDITLDELSFTIPAADYGPGRWMFEDQFGGAQGQINPVFYTGNFLPDDYLFGYFDVAPHNTLNLGPLFSPIALTPGTPLLVRMYFTEWLTEAALEDFTFQGSGLSPTGQRLDFRGTIAAAPGTTVPEPATVLLLASGLAVVGVVGAARRRRAGQAPGHAAA